MKEWFKDTNIDMRPLALVNTVIQNRFGPLEPFGKRQSTISHTAFVELNRTYTEKLIINPTCLSFLSFYPSITIALGDTLETNVPVGEFLASVYEWRKELRKSRYDGTWDDDTNTYITLTKMFINSVYGCYNHEMSVVYSRRDVRGLISKMARAIISEVYNATPYAIYADTDEIYFTKHVTPVDIARHAEDAIERHLGFKSAVPLEIEGYDNAIFFRKKKYILNTKRSIGFRKVE